MKHVSVIIPAYNQGNFLWETIQSVLDQTYPDFEIIVVDDGSTDNTPSILADYAERDPRIILVMNRRNAGLTASLNKGLAVASGAYVARLDADDMALPNRLAQQVDFLDRNSDYVLLGSAYTWIDASGRKTGATFPPTDDTSIKWQLLFNNSFGHSTVMLRRSALIAAGLEYDMYYSQTQDYDLWARFLRAGRGRNLPEPLVLYRLHDAQDTHTQAACQLAFALEVAQANLRSLGFCLSREQVILLRGVYEKNAALSREQRVEGYRLMLPILLTFGRQAEIDRHIVAELRRHYASEIISMLSLHQMLRPEQHKPLWTGWQYDPPTTLTAAATRIRQNSRRFLTGPARAILP